MKISEYDAKSAKIRFKKCWTFRKKDHQLSYQIHCWFVVVCSVHVYLHMHTHSTYIHHFVDTVHTSSRYVHRCLIAFCSDTVDMYWLPFTYPSGGQKEVMEPHSSDDSRWLSECERLLAQCDFIWKQK